MKKVIVSTLAIFNGALGSATASAQTPTETLDQLLLCGAGFYVVAADQPNILEVDGTALQMRDVFGDMASDLSLAITGEAPTDNAINSELSEKLELIEYRHKNGSDAVGLISYCLTWQAEIFTKLQRFNWDEVRTDGRHPMINFFDEVGQPSEAAIEFTKAGISADDAKGIRQSFRLWGERGYMNPDKAKRVLGLK